MKMGSMASDSFYKGGLIVVIILLVVIAWALTYYKPGAPVTTITTVTTQPTTTSTTILGITTTTTTSTTTTSTTTPIGTYGDDVNVAVFKFAKSIINAGNFVDLRLYLRNTNIYKTVKITKIELLNVDIRKGSAGDYTWGVPDGDYIITPNEFVSPRETYEHLWIVQAPTGVDTQTKYYFKARVHYAIDSTTHYTESGEILITVNP